MGQRSIESIEPMRIVLPGEDDLFDEYVETFIQRIPRYAVKPLGKGHWRTKAKPLSDPPIMAHLEGKYAVATLGKWYPEYAILDVDHRSLGEIEEIRGELGLDESNSMLCSSESEFSYHLILRPEYRGRPPTIRLLQSALKGFGVRYGIEVHPQQSRTIRLPFGSHQAILDYMYHHLRNYSEKLYWFLKLNRFDLSRVPAQQLPLDLVTYRDASPMSVLQQGKELFEHGLQAPSSRHEAQWKILYYLWRLNISQAEAERLVWRWIKEKHHGFSKDIQRYPNRIRAEIARQASRIYSFYSQANVYPDSTHNLHHGYLSEPDMREIIEATKGSLPKMRFLFQLVKYTYPRRFWAFTSIHRDKLVLWSNERTYLRYLNELEEKGIVVRGRAYLPQKYAKDLKLNWEYRSSQEAVLYEGRSVDSFEDTVRLLYTADDFRQLLKNVGVQKSTICRMIQRIWGIRDVIGEYVVTPGGEILEIPRNPTKPLIVNVHTRRREGRLS